MAVIPRDPTLINELLRLVARALPKNNDGEEKTISEQVVFKWIYFSLYIISRWILEGNFNGFKCEKNDL